MQIIIEVKNPNVLKRLLDFLKISDWVGGIRIWKRENAQEKEELVYDFSTKSEFPQPETPIDYRDFWACIQPQMGIETVDHLIAEMRED